MDPVEALRQLGGIAELTSLLAFTSRRSLRTALASGSVVRATRARYALPGADRSLQLAARVGGVVSHLSAAQHHEWELMWPPTEPWITIPRTRKFDSNEPANIVYGDVTDEPGPVMSKVATVIQCGRRLPFDQALAVADSALRHGDVLVEGLRAAAASVTGKGAPAIRRVAAEASALAANPFESALRAVAIDVPGLRVVPQHPISMHDFVIHPDLVDVDRRIVLEADSWIHHASRAGHKSDCERYNFLVLDGWLLLRYVWEQVMLHPDQVRADLVKAVAARPLRRRSA